MFIFFVFLFYFMFVEMLDELVGIQLQGYMLYYRCEMEVNYEVGKDKRVKIYEFIININKSVKSLKQEYNYVGKKYEYY